MKEKKIYHKFHKNQDFVHLIQIIYQMHYLKNLNFKKIKNKKINNSLLILILIIKLILNQNLKFYYLQKLLNYLQVKKLLNNKQYKYNKFKQFKFQKNNNNL